MEIRYFIYLNLSFCDYSEMFIDFKIYIWFQMLVNSDFYSNFDILPLCLAEITLVNFLKDQFHKYTLCSVKYLLFM